MSECICLKDDLDRWVTDRTGLLEADPSCPVHGEAQEQVEGPE